MKHDVKPRREIRSRDLYAEGCPELTPEIERTAESKCSEHVTQDVQGSIAPSSG